MASSSPAIHASRPGSLVDPHRQAEYPVLLGKSLQDTLGARNNYFSLQYNWKPKNVSSKQKGVITKDKAEAGGDAPYLLTLQEPGAETRPYRYAGNISQTESQGGSTKSPPKDQTTSLALVFDQEKSAFILEKISASLDFNLTSAPGQSRGDVQALPQLPLHTQADKPLAYTQKPAPSSSSDDDEPDSANPYDYRHFLEEARANAEKGLGSRTPIPGGISGLPSPVPGPSRFHAGGSGTGTPVHRPVTSAPSAAQVKKRKIPGEHRRDPSRPTTPSTTHNKNAATKPKPKPTTSTSMSSSSSSSSSKPKPLSKERISDSDEEIGDTITLSRPSKTHHKPTTAKPKPTYPNSPRIEVDEAADLVIDMGSPPPVTARRRLGGGISSSPFAMAPSSQPTKSTPATAGAVPAHFRPSSEEDEEEDAEGEPDDDVDVVMRDVGVDVDTDANGDGEADADGDVEDLVLGSPRASTTTTRAASVSMGRVDVGDDGVADGDEDEDEDDELAAELEAALGSDDEDVGGRAGGAGAVGLGISSTGIGGDGGVTGGAGDDESEVSEEE